MYFSFYGFSGCKGVVGWGCFVVVFFVVVGVLWDGWWLFALVWWVRCLLVDWLDLGCVVCFNLVCSCYMVQVCIVL